MRRRIVQVVEQKLTQALRDVDSSTQEQARAAWSEVGPAPNCPPVSTVMKAMHGALVHGYRERGRVAKEVVASTLAPIRSELNDRLVREVMAVVIKRFPDNTLLALVEHTPGVYQRKSAPVGRFDERVYSAELALVIASAANMSRQSVASIQTALAELALQEAVANPPWWRRAPSAMWSFIAVPAVKWVFGIISAVAIAVLTYVLGVK